MYLLAQSCLIKLIKETGEPEVLMSSNFDVNGTYVPFQEATEEDNRLL